MDPIFAAAFKRRSMRSYEKRQLPDEVLEHIIEVGRYAPSGSNKQLTHLLVLQNPEVLEDVRLVVQEEFAKMTFDPETMYHTLAHAIEAAKEKKLRFFYDAPTLVVVCNKIKHPNAMADASAVTSFMLLAASELEVGACWVNQLRWLNDNEVVRKKLISLGMQEDETAFAGVALGYAAKPWGIPLPRTGNPVTYVK